MCVCVCVLCLLLVVEAFSLQTVVKMVEEVIVRWQEIRWIWWMRQNLIAQNFKFWSFACVTWDQELSWKIRPILLTNASFKHCGFAISHEFAMHISQIKWFHLDSESYSGSDQQQTTKQWPRHVSAASLALGSALEPLLSPATELVISSSCIKSIFCVISESNQEVVCCCCIE